MRKFLKTRIAFAWLLIACMIAPMLSYAITSEAASTSVAADKNFDAMTIEQIMDLDDSVTWVFAGDSITHNATFTMGMNGYAEWFEQLLYQMPKRQNDDVINTGYGGADIRDIQSKENTPANEGHYYDPGMGLENFVTKYNPDVVFIKFGMNNRPMQIAEFEVWYKKMLDSIYEICEESYGKRPKIILLSPTPVSNENPYDDEVNPEPRYKFLDSVLNIKNAIGRIANEYNLQFVDLRTAFMNESIVLGDKYRSTFFNDSSDGTVHPNAAGQYYIFKTLCKNLGLYDETKPIFQFEYEDLNSAALYVDDTDDVNFDNGYGIKGAGTSSASAASATPAVMSLENATELPTGLSSVVPSSLPDSTDYQVVERIGLDGTGPETITGTTYWGGIKENAGVYGSALSMASGAYKNTASGATTAQDPATATGSLVQGEATITPNDTVSLEGVTGVMWYVDFSNLTKSTAKTADFCTALRLKVTKGTTTKTIGSRGASVAYYYQDGVWQSTSAVAATNDRISVPDQFKGWVYVPLSSYINANSPYDTWTNYFDTNLTGATLTNAFLYSNGYEFDTTKNSTWDEILFVKGASVSDVTPATLPDNADYEVLRRIGLDGDDSVTVKDKTYWGGYDKNAGIYGGALSFASGVYMGASNATTALDPSTVTDGTLTGGQASIFPNSTVSLEGVTGVMWYVDFSNLTKSTEKTTDFCATVRIKATDGTNTKTFASKSSTCIAYYYQDGEWKSTDSYSTTNDRIVVPDNYKGWIYVPFSSYVNHNKTSETWTNYFDKNLSGVSLVTAFLYSNGYEFDKDKNMVWDEILFVKSEQKGSGWSETVTENNTWMLAGAEQMSGYEGTVVNRSLVRLIDNCLRRGSMKKPGCQDIHVLDSAAPGYTVEKLNEEYDTIIGENDHDVFLLLPEVSQVYADGYVHSAEEVATYKATVKELLAKEAEKVRVLWTPLASNDATINDYIDDYAEAIREITEEEGLLMFDANKFMNENMAKNESLMRNWFANEMYVTPLCTTDLTHAFLEVLCKEISYGVETREAEEHNLRYTSDKRIFKGNFLRDMIAPNSVDVNGEKVVVNIEDIKKAYNLDTVTFAAMPSVEAGNYNKDIYYIEDVKVSGDTYTFTAPCSNPLIAIYGKTADGLIYRFRDFKVAVTASEDLTAAAPNPNGVYLDSLKVVGAPDLGFEKNTSKYDVNLYQYQKKIQILATAQEGLEIKVNGTVVESGVNSQLIPVEDGDKVTVTVKDTIHSGKDDVTYTISLARPEYPDIIITEVLQDGYNGYTKKGNDNYDLVEIYNASGKDLNLLDYSVGYKKGYRKQGNDVEYVFPNYYFTGNNQAIAGKSDSNSTQVTYTGINEITKYSSYWNDGSVTEPEEVNFPADSTMVIWIKCSPVDATDDEAQEFGEALTYGTLIQTLKENKDTYVLSVDGEAVVPAKDQLVVAEIPKGVVAKSLSVGIATAAQSKSPKNFYLENFKSEDASDDHAARAHLFILKDTAEQAANGTITEAGDDIISATRFVRISGMSNLSMIFSYNTDRGMSLVKNEGYYEINASGSTSDVQGYGNLTSFGAIEYWQKPMDLGDDTKPEVVNNTSPVVAEGTETSIDLTLKDNKDVRYMELYVRKAGETKYTKVTEDFVLKAGIANAGVSKDIKNKAYEYALGEITGTVEYYGLVIDGNNNQTTFGTEATPLTISTGTADNSWVTEPSISGWTYGETASTPVYEAKFGTVKVNYTGTANDNTPYDSETAPIKAGSYVATFTVEGTSSYGSLSKEVPFTVAKADQTMPNASKTDETISGKNDGTITGLTTKMEYRKTSDNTYKAVTADTLKDLADGTYYVRYAADDNHNVSAEQEIVIAAGQKLTVTVPGTQVGYTLTADKDSVDWNEKVTVTITLATGYSETDSFAVKVNGDKVTLDGGKYTFNAKEDSTITVEGVADITAPVVSGVKDGKTYYTTQKVTVTDANLDKVTVNGKEVVGDIVLAGDVNETYKIVATDTLGNETTVTVTMKTIASITKSVDDITKENVVMDDKEDLQKVKAELEKALSSDADDITAQEKKAIEDAVKHVDEELAVILNVEAVENKINKLPENITKADENAIKQADEAYNALTDYEKSLVDEDVKEALDDAKAKLEALNAAGGDTQTPENDKEAGKDNTTSAQTGDNSLVWLYVAIILLACIGGAVVVYKKKNFTR